MRVPRSVEAKILAAIGEAGRDAVVSVTIPPSTNHLFATVNGRRVKTRAYRAWLGRAVEALARLRPPTALPCELVYTLVGGPGLSELRDLGNIEKPLSDAAVEAGVIPDDCLRYVHRIVLGYRSGTGEPRVEVEARPAPKEVT